MRRTVTPDERADALASRQYGAINHQQALDAGLTGQQIKDRRRTGRWRGACRGVYVVAASPDSWSRRAMIACLAGPAGTVASYLTAAALFGLAKAPMLPHVTVPSWASGRFRGATVHRADVGPGDRCTVGPIPCTRPARTLVDCAAVVTFEALCELVDSAVSRGLTNPAGLRAAAQRASRAPGRKGLRLLEEVLEVWTPGPRPGSPAEMRLVRRLEAWGFPRPERQVAVFDPGGIFLGRLDLAWRKARFALEYDGEEFHTPRRWAFDEARQLAIEVMGWRIERVDRFDLRPSSTRLRDLLATLFAPGRAA